MNDGSGHGAGLTALTTSLGGEVTLRGSQAWFRTESGGSTWTDCFGQTFNPISGAARKQDFGPAPAGSGLDIVRQVPVRSWAYKSDPGRKMIGVVADDLPEWLRGPTAHGSTDLHLSITNMLGMLQQAIFELDTEMDQFRKDKPQRKAAQ
jgi:hypothetical protein